MSSHSTAPAPRGGASSPTDSRVPERRTGVVFALSALLVCCAVVALGWTTGLRDVMHASLLVLGALALLPFLVIAGGLAVVVVLVLGSAGMAGGGFDGDHGMYAAGEAGITLGPRFTRSYYRWLARQRHPALLGMPAGVLLGALVSWALIAVIIVPREARTLEQLLAAQARIEQAYASDGRYPEPDARGQLPGAATLDAFGRALHYEVHGRWKARSYRLRSLGADGRPSGDDLCVRGKTALQALIDQASLAALFDALRSGGASLKQRFAAIRAATCDDDMNEGN